MAIQPTHASHMGGVWEHMIGVSRRILDSLLRDHKHLTDEVLITLMAEVCQIVNAMPIAGIPSDPYTSVPLSPAMLLTLKDTHTVDAFDMEDFSPKDLYKKQWRCVQGLSNRFGNVGEMSILRNSNTGGNGMKSSAIFAKVM